MVIYSGVNGNFLSLSNGYVSKFVLSNLSSKIETICSYGCNEAKSTKEIDVPTPSTIKILLL